MTTEAESAPATFEQMKGLFDQIKPKEKKKAEAISLKVISDWLIEQEKTYHFKYINDTKRLYWYQDGVYRPDGESWIATLLEAKFPGTCRIASVNEAVAIAKRKYPLKLEDEDKNPNILNVKNGLLNLKTGILADHNPDHFSVVQLPVEYHEDATCPVIDGFIKDIVEENDVSHIPRFTPSRNIFCTRCLIIQE
jgi:phage/plasmid-associated DNA primase